MISYEHCPQQVLKVNADLLLSLSVLFEKGGENLHQTLGPFVNSCAAFSDYFKLEKLLLSKETLANCLKADPNEYALMTYEFNRLFVGPTTPEAPPYESIYLSPDHLMMGEQMLAVRKFYLQENLQTARKEQEPDDFIATEFEFSAYLLSRIMEAQAAKNDRQIQLYINLYHEFWARHLSLWLGLFARRVYQSTRHPVFSALSEVLDTLTTLNAIKHEGGQL